MAAKTFVLALLWQRFLRLQTQLPAINLGLLDTKSLPSSSSPALHPIGLHYRDEFGAEVGGIETASPMMIGSSA